MQEALLYIQEQINQIKMKRLEIQLTSDETLHLEENLKKGQKNLGYIQKILTEISKPLTKLLDEYKLEKCHSSLIRCIDYCKGEKAILEAYQRMRFGAPNAGGQPPSSYMNPEARNFG